MLAELTLEKLGVLQEVVLFSHQEKLGAVDSLLTTELLKITTSTSNWQENPTIEK
jgi:hypothetical protein